MSKEASTEGGHWYLADGSPFYTTIGRNGKERAVTLRDARKVNAVPSVTGITKVLAAPALQNYFLRQLYDAMLRVVPFSGEDDDTYFARLMSASREHSRKAANRGSKLHGAIENYLHRQPFDADWEPHIEKIIATLNQYGIDLTLGASEKSFAHPLGYGGKCDISNAADPLILDFKSKDKIDPKKRYGFKEQAMQIAAYREGLYIPKARGVNVFVGCEDIQVKIHEWTEQDLAEAWEMFRCALRIWQLDNNYVPQLEAA